MSDEIYLYKKSPANFLSYRYFKNLNTKFFTSYCLVDRPLQSDGGCVGARAPAQQTWGRWFDSHHALIFPSAGGLGVWAIGEEVHSPALGIQLPHVGRLAQ